MSKENTEKKTAVETVAALTEEQKQEVIQGVITECAENPDKWQEIIGQAVKAGEKKSVKKIAIATGIGLAIAGIGAAVGYIVAKKVAPEAVAAVETAAVELPQVLPEAAPAVADTVDAVASTVLV